MERMKELYEKVAGDAGLQAKFAKIMKDAEAAGEGETGEKLTAFAKEAGFDVTVSEMQAFFNTLAKEGELSDAELDSVAGGKLDPEKVTLSIVTSGSGCVQGSVTNQIFKGDCLEYFQQ